MSSAKSSALTLLMIGSIFLFISSIWQVVQTFFIYGYNYGYYYRFNFIGLISLGLYFIASLLFMIGFIQYRGEQSKRAQTGYGAPSLASSQQAAQARFCPKCGKQIPFDAQFCPCCGWQAAGQKRK
jgi:hypothetical protein